MTEVKKIKKPRGKVRLVPDKCIACGARCQSVCPVDGIEMSDAGEPEIVLEKCIGCLKCVKACPGSALEIFYTSEELALLAELEKQGRCRPRRSTRRRRSAGNWSPATAASGSSSSRPRGRRPGSPGSCWERAANWPDNWGSSCAPWSSATRSSISARGLRLRRDRHTSWTGRSTATTAPSRTCDACCHLIDKYRPEVILMGATGMGRDLAGAVATRRADRPHRRLHRACHRRQAQPDADPARLRRQHHGHHHVRPVPPADGHRPAPRDAACPSDPRLPAARSSGRPSPPARPPSSPRS